MKNDKALRDEELEQNIIDLVIMITYTILTLLDVIRKSKKSAKKEERPADEFESMP